LLDAFDTDDRHDGCGPGAPVPPWSARFSSFRASDRGVRVTVFAELLMVDGDAFWAIRRRMDDDHGCIRRTFSYTQAGQPCTHEWLSEILMAATYRAAGWNGSTFCRLRS
jgi:hypothetical protein